MPDSANWGDAGSDTIGHVLASRMVALPNLQKLGLGNIRPLENLPALEKQPAITANAHLNQTEKIPLRDIGRLPE